MLDGVLISDKTILRTLAISILSILYGMFSAIELPKGSPKNLEELETIALEVYYAIRNIIVGKLFKCIKKLLNLTHTIHGGFTRYQIFALLLLV